MQRINEIQDLEATLMETMMALRDLDPDAYERVERIKAQVFIENVQAA